MSAAARIRALGGRGGCIVRVGRRRGRGGGGIAGKVSAQGPFFIDLLGTVIIYGYIEERRRNIFYVLV